MASCNNCNYEEVWSVGFSINGKDCPNCGKRQYISAETKRLFMLGYLSLIFIIIFPFIIKLNNKDEPL